MGRDGPAALELSRTEDHKSVILSIKGAALDQNAEVIRNCFRELVVSNKNTVINFAATTIIDARFLGLLLMLKKELKKRGRALDLTGMPMQIERLFRLYGFGFLIV